MVVLRSAWIAAWLLATALVQADPIRDGSVGPDSTVQVAGPDFVFGEELGQSNGPLLLHSFESFSLDEGESATFTTQIPS